MNFHSPNRALPMSVAGIVLRSIGVCVFVVFALFVGSGICFAGTVTIVDGTSSEMPTTNDVWTDGFIEHHLNTMGPLSIDTSDSHTGEQNDIVVEPGVEISWTSGYTLTLVASDVITVNGTIQHDGKDDGFGGVILLAGGDIVLGTGAQLSGISVGSRHGLTRVEGANLLLQGGLTEGGNRSVILGYRAVDRGPDFLITGPISVTAGSSITATGGVGRFDYVQIGHGGAISNTNAIVDCTPTGAISIVAQDNIHFTAGTGGSAYAQVGNGGYAMAGDSGGDHTVLAGGEIQFTSGSGSGAYSQVGNGGYAAQGHIVGNHAIEAGSAIEFQGGGDFSYAQAGNGGLAASGTMAGSHVLDTGGELRFSAGSGSGAYAQAGNGGYTTVGDKSGNQTLLAGQGIFFSGGGNSAYAQAGNGGLATKGTITGNHTLDSGSDIQFVAGSGTGAYAQVGNGGYAAFGTHAGTLTSQAVGDILFSGGSNSAYAQIGNGGYAAFGDNRGDQTVTAGENISLLGGGDFAYAQIGHGGFATNGEAHGSLLVASGETVSAMLGTSDYAYAQIGHGDAKGIANGLRSGDIVLTIGADLVIDGALVGHGSAGDRDSVEDGDTVITVGQNAGNGSGRIVVNHAGSIIASMYSAPTPNGELRFYVPSADSVSIAKDTILNGQQFPGDVPAEHLGGGYSFDEGPYIPEYTFYTE